MSEMDAKALNVVLGQLDDIGRQALRRLLANAVYPLDLALNWRASMSASSPRDAVAETDAAHSAVKRITDIVVACNDGVTHAQSYDSTGVQADRSRDQAEPSVQGSLMTELTIKPCPRCGHTHWEYREEQVALMRAPFHGFNAAGGVIIGDVELDQIDGDSTGICLECKSCYLTIGIPPEMEEKSEYMDATGARYQ